MSFFAKKEKTIAVYQISPSGVAGSVMRSAPSGVPEIIYAHEHGFPSRETASPETHITDMLSALHDVVAHMEKNGLMHLVDGMALSVSAPWSHSSVKNVVIKRSDEFMLTQGYVDKLVSNHHRLFSRGTAGIDRDLVDVEKKIIDAKFDGRRSDDFYSARARKVELSILTTTMPYQLMRRVREIIGASGERKLAVFSFPLAAFDVVRSIFHEKDDFAVVNVGDHASEIITIKHGMVEDVSSVGLGRARLIRQAAERLGVPAAEAESLVSLHGEGRAESRVAGSLDELMMSVAAEWARHLRLLPSDVFILSGGGVEPLRDGVPLAPESLRGAVRYATGVRGSASLAVSVAFAGKLID